MRSLLSATSLAFAFTLTACGGGGLGGGPDMEEAHDTCVSIVEESLRAETESFSDAPLDADVVMRVGDDGDTVTVAPLREVDFLERPSVMAAQCMMNELDAPDSVVSKVGQVRALDGQQEESWDGVEMSYSYRSGYGFSGVFTTN